MILLGSLPGGLQSHMIWNGHAVLAPVDERGQVAGTGPRAAAGGGDVGPGGSAAGGGQRRSTQQDEDGKYLSHDRKVYAPAGYSSVTAAVGPMSCPARHNEVMRMPVAENYVVLSARNRP
jgi:hypothetical protein